MATINKLDTSKGKITVNLPFINDDGSDSKYIISANQIGWAGGKLNDITFDTTIELLEVIENAINDVASKVQTSSPTGTSTSGPTLTFTNFDATLQWGKSITVASINNGVDNDITVKLPANPDTNVKVTSVDNHYTARQITTEGLYKIKTDAAGHIISAISFNDFIEKSKVNELKQDIVNFKAYILGLSSSTTSSSSTTTSSSTTSTATVTVTPTVTPTGESSVTPTVTPTGDSSVTPEPDTTTPTTTEGLTTTPTTTSSTATVTVTNPDSVTATPEPDTTTPTTTESVTTPTTTVEEVTTPTTTEEVTTPTTPMTTEISTEEPVTETPVTSVTTGK